MKVTPLAGALGAEVSGIDLGTPLDETLFERLHAVFLEHLVLFFPGQSLSPAQHRAFAGRFGELDRPAFKPPFAMPPVAGFPEIYQIIKEPDNESINIGGFWHADVTHRERPNLASIAYVREAPACGGDTLFANLYLAYESLSDGLKAFLSRLNAVHSSTMPHAAPTRKAAVGRGHAGNPDAIDYAVEHVEGEALETVHPVVRRHPETGRRSLYINRAFTSHFHGWTVAESLPLLEYLWHHMERPEFTCRYRWTAGTVGIWDNRCVLHYALNDYYGQRRVLHRISVNEPERPSA